MDPKVVICRYILTSDECPEKKLAGTTRTQTRGNLSGASHMAHVRPVSHTVHVRPVSIGFTHGTCTTSFRPG